MYNLYKHVLDLLFLYFFCSKNFQLFFVSLYKELLKPTFLPFPRVFDNLCEVSECFVITDFLLTVLRFSKVFGWLVIISDCFTDFLFFFLKKDWKCSLALWRSGISLVVCLKATVNLFFSSVSLNNNCSL